MVPAMRPEDGKPAVRSRAGRLADGADPRGGAGVGYAW
jgi:hypothetical protein